MNKNELMDALNLLEKEKDISKEVLLETIEQSLITAYKNNFDKAENVTVTVDRETGEFKLYASKEVVEKVEDKNLQISLDDARAINAQNNIGDTINIEVKSKEFGRIAAQNAKNVILQKIREEERKNIFDKYRDKENDIVTGIVQRISGKNVFFNLGKADAVLVENEQVPGERFDINDRVKLYITEVKDAGKGPKINVSRNNPDLVKRLFEQEVAEIHDGTVVIKSIAREAGSRTKMAVLSTNERVDAVGTCVGINGGKVTTVIRELFGEKIDIINWDENPAILIENALSPAKVVSVEADTRDKSAKVVVPDYQLSLAIGKAGQNARLAAKLTGYKIDIKSESQIEELNNPTEYIEDVAVDEEENIEVFNQVDDIEEFADEDEDSNN